jgi:hypothetical protein
MSLVDIHPYGSASNVNSQDYRCAILDLLQATRRWLPYAAVYYEVESGVKYNISYNY